MNLLASRWTENMQFKPIIAAAKLKVHRINQVLMQPIRGRMVWIELPVSQRLDKQPLFEAPICPKSPASPQIKPPDVDQASCGAQVDSSPEIFYTLSRKPSCSFHLALNQPRLLWNQPLARQNRLGRIQIELAAVVSRASVPIVLVGTGVRLSHGWWYVGRREGEESNPAREPKKASNLVFLCGARWREAG
jgi:hypothetical protein